MYIYITKYGTTQLKKDAEEALEAFVDFLSGFLISILIFIYLCILYVYICKYIYI